MSSCDRARIESLFHELDAFLRVQFEVLAGAMAPDAVPTAHAALVEHVGRLRAEDPARAVHWDRWLERFRGSDVLLFGFPALRRDRLPDGDPEHYLRAQQIRLRHDDRAAVVRQRLDLDYERLLSSPLFASIRDCDGDWLERNDVPLRAPADPHEVAARLFRLDDKPEHASRLTLEFREITGPRFFMARLNSEPRCLVAHPPVTTVFGLSSLAHEIGHASSYELHRSFETAFIAVDDDVSQHERSEVDSYRYERLTAENTADVAGPLLECAASTSEVLWKRKTLQAFRHILSCHLAGLFFAGHELDELSARFEALMRRHLPTHDTAGGWLAATDLARPLARLPFVHAFGEVFL